MYTPIEIVDFINQSVADLLEKEFNCSIADNGIHVLDPFSGTGTFIARLMQSGLIPIDRLPNNPSLADSGKQKALNSLIISEFRAFLNYCLVYMLEHVLNQLRNCLLCCKSYS